MEEEYISVTQASKILKCSAMQVYRMIDKKMLEYYINPMNSRILLKKEDVLALLRPVKGS